MEQLCVTSLWCASWLHSLAIKLFLSTNISKPGPNVALGEKNSYRSVMKSFSLVLLAVAECPVGVGQAGKSISSFVSVLWVSLAPARQDCTPAEVSTGNP